MERSGAWLKVTVGEVEQHYGLEDLIDRVSIAMEQAGLTEKPLDWKSLAPLDQFHVQGIEATRELSQRLSLSAGDSVLDIGCGLGGPARYLAATYGCDVVGIDLNASFVALANYLSERTGLKRLVRCVQGDALDLPFEDCSFDNAWTQHVAMNIADRKALYSGIHRVLKPGARFAIFDVIAGDKRPLIFPVPWAADPNISFLLTEEQMREVLLAAGFQELYWEDATEESIEWFEKQQGLRAGVPDEMKGFNPSLIMGPGFREAAANLEQNLRQERARIVEVIVRRN